MVAWAGPVVRDWLALVAEAAVGDWVGIVAALVRLAQQAFMAAVVVAVQLVAPVRMPVPSAMKQPGPVARILRQCGQRSMRAVPTIR